jgi:hypothetical protein
MAFAKFGAGWADDESRPRRACELDRCFVPWLMIERGLSD